MLPIARRLEGFHDDVSRDLEAGGSPTGWCGFVDWAVGGRSAKVSTVRQSGRLGVGMVADILDIKANGLRKLRYLFNDCRHISHT